MTLTDEQIAEIRARAEAATPGPWYHCQPFQTVPAQRTIHGPVPEQRVDYVSTWEGPGTPKGHCVVAHMDGREAGMRSKDMAFIAAANPAAVLALLSALDAAIERAEKAEALVRLLEDDETVTIITALRARVADLEAMARDFVEVIRKRHFGRMPDEVQVSFDALDAALKEKEPGNG